MLSRNRLAALRTAFVVSLLLTCGCSSKPVGNLAPDPCECGPCAATDEECLLCGDGICDRGESTTTCPDDCTPTQDLDLLMVIDNSGSVAGEAAPFYSIPALVDALRAAPGGMPNLHVGVISTDVSVGNNEITYCDAPDNGRLIGMEQLHPDGVLGGTFLVDVQPVGCSVVRASDGICTSHDCEPQSCAPFPHTTLQPEQQTGCPRCRNFVYQSLSEALRVSMGLGTTGCGFEQPMEAVRLALNDHPDNVGFLREGSVLGLWFYTNEDDCSAADTRLYSDPDADVDSELGPLTAYRCFEWSTTCDLNDRSAIGPRTGCVERTDGSELLHPVSRYVDFLCGLRDPGHLVLGGLAGPVTPSATALGMDVTVGSDTFDHPELQYTCTNAVNGATPPLRLHRLISAFTPDALMEDALGSFCGADHTVAFRAYARLLVQHTTDATLTD